MSNYIIEGDLVDENYGLKGQIISKFDHVINIETKQTKGFAITDSKVVLAPYHIKVSDYIFKKILKNIKDNSKIIINKNNIIYGKSKYNFKEKRIFKGEIQDCSFISKEDLIKWSEKVIKEAIGLGSLDQTILNYLDIIKDIDAFELTVLQREFYKKLKGIIKNEISINELLGLGIGLTPTGDDFIVGYLSALEANLIEDNFNIKKEIDIKQVFNKTTRVSALHLKGAYNHQFNEKLVEIYKNLTEGKEQYIKHAKNLIKVGNSSGLDMLTGLYFGLVMQKYNKSH